jgi:hypothetical protein
VSVKASGRDQRIGIVDSVGKRKRSGRDPPQGARL